MYISDLSIKNRFINVKNINMEFEDNGIYFVLGENGCGKTTLIEQILFGNDNTYFKNKEEQNMYETQRYNLFSYCPQKIVVNELRVKEYICKLNSGIDVSRMEYYIRRFGFDNEVLQQRFYTLSGGEQMKISIITALLKDTPYLFMDEPTNYLDNNAVKELVSIIEEEAKRKRIIIVSHDPRLSFNHAYKYKFEDNNIITLAGDVDSNVARLNNKTTKKGNVKLPKTIKMILGLTKNYAFILTFVIIICLLSAILTVTNLDYGESIDDSKFPNAGSIFSYNVGYHDNLNEYYESAENLIVDENKYELSISLNDIEKLSELKGVNNIYILDDEYLYNLDCFLGQVPGVQYVPENNIFLLSCPELLYNEYLESSGFGTYLKYTEGDLPKDNANEIVISKNILIDNYRYTQENVDNAIGDSISIYNEQLNKQEEYKIVGFSYYDIAVISYDRKTSYGMYCYDEKTFAQFSEKIINYYVENGMDVEFNNVLIDVQKEREQEVLNYCMVNFPANCYNSNYYAMTYVQKQLYNSYSRWLKIHILFAVIIAALIWVVNKNGIKYNMRMIWDIGNYYINRKKIMKYYIVAVILCYFIINGLIVLGNTLLSNYVKWTNSYIVMDSLIVLLPILLTCVLEYKEANK